MPVQMLRHTLATLAYRGAKAVRGAPADFAQFRAAPSSRSAGEILAHIGDLLDWALGLVNGKYEWHDSTALPWDQGAARFFAALQSLDGRLASSSPLGFSPEKIFQGPIADALAHVGQISMLRRISGSPVRGESYFKAAIVAGRLGPDQEAPGFEFD